MDDDVQYLGTKFASVDNLDDPCEVHPSLTGITLHVDKSGDKPAHALTFYRARSCYINIGRKSGSDDRSMRRANDDHNVVFSCQVISARHAKLVFSDAGQVYIVDLHSRHGTHLLKRGESTPRMLQPEIETLLSDGDLLTFGKAVGAGSYHVSPVTVRVELLNDYLTSEPFKVRANTPFDAQSPVLSRPRKLSSGRYGLISSQATSCVESSDSSHSSSSSISVSSDAPSSPSEQGSDLEDEHGCIPAVLRYPIEKTSVKIPAFRSFIRDIYHTTIPHSSISDIPGEPLEDEAPGTPPSTDIVREPSPALIILESPRKSRSHSPMEVATPSPSPSPRPEAHQSEPAIIGAWPASRPESPRHPSLEVEIPLSEVPPVPEPERREPELVLTPPVTFQNRIAPISNDAIMELMHRLPPPPPFFPMGGPFSNSIASDFGLPPVPHPPPPPPAVPLGCRGLPPFHLHKAMTDCVSTEVKGTFKGVEDRITALQETVTDLRSRQTVTEEDMVDIQSHFETFEPDSLLCRIAGAERNIATLSMLQGQVNALQNQVTTIRGRLQVPEPKAVENMDDFKVCAAALNNLVTEMRSLREDVEKRIEAKIETIQKARTEALDALKEVVSEVEHVRTSKRKREDEMEEEETPNVVATLDAPVNRISREEIQASEVSVPIQQVLLSEADISLAKLDDVCRDEPHAVEPIQVRPKKRARKAMYTVVHTAAAMAIGAVTAWSALAFS